MKQNVEIQGIGGADLRCVDHTSKYLTGMLGLLGVIMMSDQMEDHKSTSAISRRHTVRVPGRWFL